MPANDPEGSAPSNSPPSPSSRGENDKPKPHLTLGRKPLRSGDTREPAGDAATPEWDPYAAVEQRESESGDHAYVPVEESGPPRADVVPGAPYMPFARQNRPTGESAGPAPYMPFARRNADPSSEPADPPTSSMGHAFYSPPQADEGPSPVQPPFRRQFEAMDGSAPTPPPPPIRLRTGAGGTLSAPAEPLVVDAVTIPTFQTASPRRGPTVAVLGLLALLVAGGGGWMAWKRHNNSLTTPVAASSTDSAPPDIVTATLSLTTQPPGATVIINGKQKGVTPLVLKDLSPDIYDVEIHKAGFQSVHKKLGLDSGQQLTQSFHLDRGGKLVLQGLPDGSRVLVDDNVQASHSVTLSSGAHLVVIDASGYAEYRHTVTVPAGKTLTLAPHLAEVSVPVQPAAVDNSGPSQPNVVVMPAPNAAPGTAPYRPGAPSQPHQPDSNPAAPAPPPPKPAAGVVVGERHDLATPDQPQSTTPPGY